MSRCEGVRYNDLSLFTTLLKEDSGLFLEIGIGLVWRMTCSPSTSGSKVSQ